MPKWLYMKPGRALTWKGGMGMCSPEDPFFTLLSCHSQDPQLRLKSVHKTIISKINVKFCLQKSTFSENMTNFSSRSSNLVPIFIKKLRNLINYQFSSPCFWWKSTHKTPLSRQFIRSQAPKFGNPSRTYLPEKKLSAPHPDMKIIYFWQLDILYKNYFLNQKMVQSSFN